MEKSIESVVEDMSRVKEEKKCKIRILGAWLEVVRATAAGSSPPIRFQTTNWQKAENDFAPRTMNLTGWVLD